MSLAILVKFNDYFALSIVMDSINKLKMIWCKVPTECASWHLCPIGFNTDYFDRIFNSHYYLVFGLEKRANANTYRPAKFNAERNTNELA